MSHVVKVKTVIKSLNALRRAAERCGLELVEGVSNYKWFGKFVGDSPMPDGFYWVDPATGKKYGHGKQKLGLCDHVLRVPGNQKAYEVGVYSTGKDEYGIIWDWWGAGYGLCEKIGRTQNGAEKLLDEYAFAVAEEVAHQNGWQCSRTPEGLEISIWDPVANKMGTVTITAEGVDADGFVGGSCQDPVTRIADAMGVATETVYKPEYFEQVSHIKETGY